MHGSAAMNDEPHPGVLASLWKYRAMSAAIVAVMVVLSVGVGYVTQPRAQAKATIALASPPAKSVLAPGVQGDASLARYTAQRAAYVTSDAVLRTVAASLHRKDITQLRHDISATPSSSANTISIVAEADSGREAVQLATATVAAYRSKTLEEVQHLTDAAIASIDESRAPRAEWRLRNVRQLGPDHAQPARGLGERDQGEQRAVRGWRRLRRRIRAPMPSRGRPSHSARRHSGSCSVSCSQPPRPGSAPTRARPREHSPRASGTADHGREDHRHLRRSAAPIVARARSLSLHQ